MSESAITIIAACLNGQKDWLRAATNAGLKADDFLLATHQDIWRAIEKIRDSGRGVRLGSVETELRHSPDAQRDARSYADRGPSFQTAEVHVECVIIERLKLELRALLADISASINGAETIEQFQAKVREGATLLDALALRTNASARDNAFLPVFSRTIAEMEAQLEAQRSGKAPWVTTGVPALDRAIGGGWQSPGFYVVVGMSGKGKTHLGIHFALEAATAGAAAVYFTVEMPQTQIMRRVMANAAQIPSSSLAAIDFDETQLKRLQHIPGTHGKACLAIEDNFSANLENLVSLIRKYKRAGKLQVAVIDYIQQLVPTKRQQTKQQEMLAVAHELKQVCIHEGIVMIVLAQANREAEAAEALGQKLGAPHIEHSHAIYQNADMVAFFQTHERKEKEFGTNRIDRVIKEEMFYIAKNRHGESGKMIPVRLDYEHSKLRGYD